MSFNFLGLQPHWDSSKHTQRACYLWTFGLLLNPGGPQKSDPKVAQSRVVPHAFHSVTLEINHEIRR